eukprot:4358616-Pyramimonas_sp.AAC.1
MSAARNMWSRRCSGLRLPLAAHGRTSGPSPEDGADGWVSVHGKRVSCFGRGESASHFRRTSARYALSPGYFVVQWTNRSVVEYGVLTAGLARRVMPNMGEYLGELNGSEAERFY